jgi:fucose permease
VSRGAASPAQLRPPGRDGGARLHRDALTGAGYSALATWAWLLYGFGSLLPLLRAEEGTSRTVMGLHSLALSAGALISGTLTVPMVRRLRRRGTMRLGLTLLATGTVALCLSRHPSVSLPAVLVLGTGGSIMVNSANPALSEHHRSTGPAVLSEANAVAAGIGLIAPLAVGGGVALGWGWRPAAAAVLPLALGVWWLLHRVPADTPAVDAQLERHEGRPGRLGLRFWLFAGALIACVGIEFVCTAWSADLLRQQTGMAAAAASAAVTAVVGGMAAGRALIGRLALRIPARQLLFAALGVTAAGWLVTWLSTAPVIAVCGLVLTGVGIAGHYPLGVSLVFGSVPGQGDRATSRVSQGIGVSAGLSPFLVGALADATSTHVAFVLVPALVAAATGLLLAAVRAPHPAAALT